MIPLVLKAEISGATEPFVVRLTKQDAATSEALVADLSDGSVGLVTDHAQVRFAGAVNDLLGDVVLVDPRRSIVHRLVRANSMHNTFMVTERCDQLCVMCSQPPKKTHDDLFGYFQQAAILAPKDAYLGITGGEPTLYKQDLFGMIRSVLTVRPDISFHVLSNAQHFTEDDLSFLRSEHGQRIIWGVPLYSNEAEVHDEIVGKEGAFEALQRGLSILCRAGATVELRTVVMSRNAHHLPELARFVAATVPFAHPWALMQLERIGFAKNRWSDLFFDNSRDFAPVAAAIDAARLSGLDVRLYNFPLCTVPPAYRRFAPSTISDWKRRYLSKCSSCPVRTECGGFFEWYPEQAGYERIGLQ